ncbi:unnamed protein product [Arabidopsis halleri]
MKRNPIKLKLCVKIRGNAVLSFNGGIEIATRKASRMV